MSEAERLKGLGDRDINVLVARHVMGWKICDDPWSQKRMCSMYDEPHQTPLDFATSWEAMGLLVEKMRERGFEFQLTSSVNLTSWWAEFWKTGSINERGANNKSAPRAVSEAALRAAGGDDA